MAQASLELPTLLLPPSEQLGLETDPASLFPHFYWLHQLIYSPSHDFHLVPVGTEILTGNDGISLSSAFLVGNRMFSTWHTLQTILNEGKEWLLSKLSIMVCILGDSDLNAYVFFVTCACFQQQRSLLSNQGREARNECWDWTNSVLSLLIVFITLWLHPEEKSFQGWQDSDDVKLANGASAFGGFCL